MNAAFAGVESSTPAFLLIVVLAVIHGTGLAGFQHGQVLGRIFLEVGHALFAAKAHLDAFVIDHMDLAHRSEFLAGDDADFERIGLARFGGFLRLIVGFFG